MIISIDDLDGRGCQGGVDLDVEKRNTSYVISTNMISTRAIGIAERLRIDFHLWKLNEVARGANFREGILTDNVFRVNRTILGPWQRLAIKNDNWIKFWLRLRLADEPHGVRCACILMSASESHETFPRTPMWFTFSCSLNEIYK